MKTFKRLQSRTILLISLPILLLFIITGCSKSSDPIPGANEVLIVDFAFSPGTLTVAVNTTVTWTNMDAAVHNVTSNTAGLFSSGSMNNGATYTHQFTTAGTFNYTCTIHPSMTGTIIVQ